MPGKATSRRRGITERIGEVIGDQDFDALCETSASLFRVKYSCVSLLDARDRRIVGSHGFGIGRTEPYKTICNVTAQADDREALVVLDAAQDARFAEHSFVAGPPHIRFYAGIAIDLGLPSLTATICIADSKPRATFTRADERRLRDLASFVRTTLYARHYRAEAAQALADSRDAEQRFKLIADHTSDIIVVGDLDLNRTYVSPAVSSVLGYEPAEFIGTPISEFIHPDDVHLIINPLDLAMRKAGRFARTQTLRYRHKAGHYVWLEISACSAEDTTTKRPVGYVAMLRDVTQRRLAEEQVRHVALHDILTGLPNRSLFRDRLKQALSSAAHNGHRVAVLLCDLDGFRSVNDSLGQAAGDKLLRIVGRRMTTILEPRDTLARVGGDAFAIIVSEVGGGRPWTCLAERLIKAVGTPVRLTERMIETSLSIGATVEDGSGQAEDVFKHAEIALHEAKAAGGNTHRAFRAQDAARVTKHGQLALDLREALRRHEFHLLYQPVVEIHTSCVVSFEALLRWRHPQDGEVPPTVFVPIAEETGSIVGIGEWVLRQACKDAVDWPPEVRVAVNVSAIQLRREGFRNLVAQSLAAAGLPAERLKLEITESVLLEGTEEVILCLHGLRRLGIKIALDDFGTGYSSLNYLRRFPFDVIKIDRAFAQDIQNAEAASIIKAIVGIGDRLGMRVVAEGIETDEQLALIRREGCRYVQGFLFSRPMPGSAISQFLEEPERVRCPPVQDRDVADAS